MRSCGSSVRVSAVSGSAPDAVVSSAVVIFVSATAVVWPAAAELSAAVVFFPAVLAAESAAVMGGAGCAGAMPATGAPFLPECVESAVAIGWLGCVACRLSVPCSGLAVWAEAAGIVWVVPGPTVRVRLSRAKRPAYLQLAAGQRVTGLSGRMPRGRVALQLPCALLHAQSLRTLRFPQLLRPVCMRLRVPSRIAASPPGVSRRPTSPRRRV